MQSSARSLAKTFAARHVFSWVLPAALLLITSCVQPAPVSTPYPSAPETVSKHSFDPPRSSVKVTDLEGTPFTQPDHKEIKVGLLLPLSGRHSDLGEALQKAATLALFDRYAGLSPQMAATKVILVTEDTGDTVESARAAARNVLQQRVSLVIGPVFSDHVKAIRPLTAEAGIPVISFSNNPGVAGNGAYIFGFSPEAQTKRVIDFAANRQVKAIAALTPNDGYGTSVLKAAADALRQHDTGLMAQGVYAPQGIGLEAALSNILPQGGAPGFQGLFLPEGSTALDTVIRAIDTRGLRTQYGVRLLGTGLWDDAALVRRVNLEGAWLATSPPNLTQSFERRYRNIYNALPPRIASLAYDAVSLAVTLATTRRGFSHETLTHAAGFAGPANGIFRFLKDGTSQRGLAVVEINGRNFRVISPAPTAFAVQ